jgi:hypothetical protein
MRPFNLQEALAGKPVVTRDGKEVKQIAYFPDAKTYPVVAYSSKDEVDTYTEDGKFLTGTVEGSRDLFMVSTKKTGFVNIYRDNIFSYANNNDQALYFQGNAHMLHSSKEVADEKQDTTRERIAVIEIT